MVPGNATMLGIGNSATWIKGSAIGDSTHMYAGNKSLDQLPGKWVLQRLMPIKSVQADSRGDRDTHNGNETDQQGINPGEHIVHQDLCPRWSINRFTGRAVPDN